MNPEIISWINNNKYRVQPVDAACNNCLVNEQMIDEYPCEKCIVARNTIMMKHCNKCIQTRFVDCHCDCRNCRQNDPVYASCDKHNSGKCRECYKSVENGYYNMIYHLFINGTLSSSDVILNKNHVYSKMLEKHIATHHQIRKRDRSKYKEEASEILSHIEINTEIERDSINRNKEWVYKFIREYRSDIVFV